MQTYAVKRSPFAALAVVAAFAAVLVLAPFFAHAAVEVYKTQSKRDYYSRSVADMRANGNLGEYTAAHGYPQYPSNVASPTGNRICYLYDPTAYITWWSLGGFKSPGNNSMAAWDPALGKWYKKSAKSFGNKRYNYLTCMSDATADTSLTASKLQITKGESVTLNWYTQYGQIRKATCTATNFDLNATVQGQQRTRLIGGEDCWLSVLGLRSRAQCYAVDDQGWTGESTLAQPFSGSKVVSPEQTTTYTYTCTNANGVSNASVTVEVLEEVDPGCSDTRDNDGDGAIDQADPGCIRPPVGADGGLPGGPPKGESADTPDLIASAVGPANITSGAPITLSATVKNVGGKTTGKAFTNLFQIDNDADHTTITATKTAPMDELPSGEWRNTSAVYTFPTSGTWYLRACADKSALDDVNGAVAEYSEENNCSQGGWREVNVANVGALLSADPSEVTFGNFSNLTWACKNADEAKIEPGIGSVTPASGGSVATPKLTTTTGYQLSCIGDETLKAFATVTVLPPNVTLTASPNLVKRGGSATISWNISTGATGCSIFGPGLPIVHALTGSETITNIQNESTFTASCTGVSKSVTVNIAPDFIEE
jgi:hypothetical protein